MKIKVIGENKYFGNIHEQFFKNRGIDNYLDFINLKNYVPTDPLAFKNMDVASEFLVKNEGKNVCIIPDVDIDGVSSTGIIYNYLSTYMDFEIKISQHKKKVHGIRMDELSEYGLLKWMDILIVPDAGSTDFSQHEQLKEEYGIDIIVLDHHPVSEYSKHAIVVNNQISGVSKNLTGSAMAYKFIQALDDLIGENGADDFLDLVALGLIGDMADTRDLEVQYLIQKGISSLANEFFLTIVKENYNINENKLSPTTLAFSIIPMINACTRIATFEEMQFILHAICNIDDGEKYPYTFQRGKRKGVTVDENIYQHAHRVAQSCKSRQNNIVDKAFLGTKRPLKEGLIDVLNRNGVDKEENKIIVVDATDYIENSGLSGLLANKIMYQYNKPTLVLFRKKDEFRGSGRGEQIPMLKTRLKESGIAKFAEGHEPAFGVRFDNTKTISEINLELNEYFKKEDCTIVNMVDFSIPTEYLTKYLIHDFEQLEEFFGTGLKEPLIYLENILVKTNTIETGSKNNLLKFKFNDVDFVKFKMSESQIEKVVPWDANVCYNIICKPNVNDFNGRRNMQLVIEKIEVVELYNPEQVEREEDEECELEW